jgi:NAD-dependent SIR2 family protein deacetylase
LTDGFEKKMRNIYIFNTNKSKYFRFYSNSIKTTKKKMTDRSHFFIDKKKQLSFDVCTNAVDELLDLFGLCLSTAFQKM